MVGWCGCGRRRRGSRRRPGCEGPGRRRPSRGPTGAIEGTSLTYHSGERARVEPHRVRWRSPDASPLAARFNASATTSRTCPSSFDDVHLEAVEVGALLGEPGTEPFLDLWEVVEGSADLRPEQRREVVDVVGQPRGIG